MKHFHVPGVHNPVPNSPENFDTHYVIPANLIGLDEPRIY